MTRNKLAQNAKNQDRSNIFKNKLKSTKAIFLAPQTHNNHQNHTGFITFFEHQVFANICPFPATRNPPRDRFLRRRSNVIKIMVWAQIRPLETPSTGPTCQYYQGRVQNSSLPRQEPIFGNPQKCRYFQWNFTTFEFSTSEITIFPMDFQYF